MSVLKALLFLLVTMSFALYFTVLFFTLFHLLAGQTCCWLFACQCLLFDSLSCSFFTWPYSLWLLSHSNIILV